MGSTPNNTEDLGKMPGTGRYIVAQMIFLKWSSSVIGNSPQWQAKEPMDDKLSSLRLC